MRLFTVLFVVLVLAACGLENSRYTGPDHAYQPSVTNSVIMEEAVHNIAEQKLRIKGGLVALARYGYWANGADTQDDTIIAGMAKSGNTFSFLLHWPTPTRVVLCKHPDDSPTFNLVCARHDRTIDQIVVKELGLELVQ